MLAEGRTSSDNRDRRSAVRMVRIVNRRHNMGSV